MVGGASILFGERVGLRRWLAIGAGFLGVLVILRPGTDGFSALSLLAVAGMLGLAGLDVFALILGRAMFFEVPDLWMPAGAAMVVGSGIYALTSAKGSAG